VRVFRLVTENTVEEKVVERAQQKLKLDAMGKFDFPSSYENITICDLHVSDCASACTIRHLDTSAVF
jgi:hypothetical protein